MVAKKYYCDKEQGNIEIKFSKAELGRGGIIALCDYEKTDSGKYEVTMDIGVEGYEILKPYKSFCITSTYSNLKDNLINYIKNDLNMGTSEKILAFIDNNVRPVYIKSAEEIGTIYKVEDLTGRCFHINVYSERTDYYLESTNNTKKEKVFTVYKKQELGEICRFISDQNLKV